MSPSENNKQGRGSQEGLWGALVASSSLPCALYEDLVWFLARAALTHPQLHIFRQQFPAFTYFHSLASHLIQRGIFSILQMITSEAQN